MPVPAPRTSPLAGLGVTVPVLAAPMAGGPTTPALVAAAAAGDPEAVHLWAGTGYQHAVTGRATDVLCTLAAAL
jgi:NAD(P)H-dependent flavin oxidoreductase YrpB (nitropropane dioxygenase family)